MNKMKYEDIILIKTHPSYNGKNGCTICYFKGLAEALVNIMFSIIIAFLIYNVVDDKNLKYLIVSLEIIYILFESKKYKKWKNKCNDEFINLKD